MQVNKVGISVNFVKVTFRIANQIWKNWN